MNTNNISIHLHDSLPLSLSLRLSLSLFPIKIKAENLHFGPWINVNIKRAIDDGNNTHKALKVEYKRKKMKA